MSLTPIPVDLDVYKALEANRRTFDEPHNSILRRLLNLNGDGPVESPSADRVRSSRTTGDYILEIGGEKIRVRSIREALSSALLKIEALRPGFFEKLTNRPTTRGRRIVARSPGDVYPNKPHLATHAAPLNGEWYFDTNISRRACERYLVIAALVAGIPSPRLL